MSSHSLNSRSCSDPTDDGLVDSLADNIGRVVTIFTQSGGCSGRGFTGLLVSVNSDTCKLVTSLPTAPRSPFGISDFRDADDRRRCHCGSRLGTAVVIPINKIVSFVFNDI